MFIPELADNMKATELAMLVAEHKSSQLILKSILNRMLHENIEQTEKTINQVIVHHPLIDDFNTRLLNISVRDTAQMSLEIEG